MIVCMFFSSHSRKLLVAAIWEVLLFTGDHLEEKHVGDIRAALRFFATFSGVFSWSFPFFAAYLTTPV